MPPRSMLPRRIRSKRKQDRPHLWNVNDYYDYYSYSSPPAYNPVFTIISLVLCVFVLVCMWIIFRKAGKPGWAAIVPFYNLYVLFDITWGSGMRFLLLIPIYNIILGIQTQVRLARVFGKSGGFAAGLIFLPYIFIPLLAFGKETYQGVPVKAAPYQNNPYQQGGYSQQPQQFQYAAPPQQPAPQQPETETRTSAFCPRCGVKSSGEKFCQNCGTPLR